MKCTLLVFTDGRRACLERTMDSFENAVGDIDVFDDVIVIDDSQNPGYSSWLAERFDRYKSYLIHISVNKLGFCGAVNQGWRSIRGDTTHVFHLEDDFEFLWPVEISLMATVLDANPNLVQMSLKRQPWSKTEIAEGDLVWPHPENFIEVKSLGAVWVEHREYFTTNPNIMRAEWVRQGWPSGPECEGKFGLQLKANPLVKFGIWGPFGDSPKVHHIGQQRVGTGY